MNELDKQSSALSEADMLALAQQAIPKFHIRCFGPCDPTLSTLRSRDVRMPCERNSLVLC